MRQLIVGTGETDHRRGTRREAEDAEDGEMRELFGESIVLVGMGLARSENEISCRIIGAALEVHSALGPGLLESAYEVCLYQELTARGIRTQRQFEIPVTYRGVALECGYRADLLVEEEVIVELKAVDRLQPVHFAQALTYLRLSEKKLCLLLNFNEAHLRDGIHRVVNRL